jgi:hypothetical protein
VDKKIDYTKELPKPLKLQVNSTHNKQTGMKFLRSQDLLAGKSGK